MQSSHYSVPFFPLPPIGPPPPCPPPQISSPATPSASSSAVSTPTEDIPVPPPRLHPLPLPLSQWGTGQHTASRRFLEEVVLGAGAESTEAGQAGEVRLSEQQLLREADELVKLLDDPKFVANAREQFWRNMG